MFSPLPLSLIALLPLHVFASSPAGQAMPLTKRTPWNRTSDDWGSWAKNQRQGLRTKYGDPTIASKRSTGTNLLTDQSIDSSYYGSLAIGTPAVSYNVILDTGSADLWIADSACTTGCSAIETFDASASSTFVNSSTPFSVTYGSGAARGALGKDTVQMAGFQVTDQSFGVCDEVSQGMLNAPVSGLLGLAFQSLSSAGVSPFWQSLVSNGAWDSPLMAFQLTRFLNDTSATRLEYGGSFTMGFVNQSLYTGDIDYIDIPAGQSKYWTIPLTALSVSGSALSLASGSESYAAIDTGTTLVGGPADAIAEIYALIPNSQQATGNYEGYWSYPCDNAVTVTMSFGGQTWSISPDDFQLTQISSTLCIGAFFELTTGTGTPPWIIGDTFLKNVYSVFRYSPASIGFAQLSSVAKAESGGEIEVPTATIGSVAAAVSATGRTTSLNGALERAAAPGVGLASIFATVAFLL